MCVHSNVRRWSWEAYLVASLVRLFLRNTFFLGHDYLKSKPYGPDEYRKKRNRKSRGAGMATQTDAYKGLGIKGDSTDSVAGLCLY